MQSKLGSKFLACMVISVLCGVLGLNHIVGSSSGDQVQDIQVSQIDLREGPVLDKNHGLIADPGSNPMYLPPRQDPSRAMQTSTIVVNWNPSSCTYATSAWDPEAQAAFAYAADIWESLMVSTVQIEVDACWSPLGTNVLGSAGAVNIGRDFAGAPQNGVWYPIALINAITDVDQNGDSSEIKANFSSNFTNWYFGTDGNPAWNQYDFVSVVLHEIGHGLGFAGSMTTDPDTGQGYFGYFNNPFVYDVNVENGAGNTLITTYSSGSTALGSQLVSGDIFHAGPNVTNANGGNPAELYSPATWTQGSSFSHWNTTFNGTENALMTHSISNGQAIHDPGLLTLALFKDLGWEIGSSVQIPTATPTPTLQPTNTPAPTNTPDPSATNTPVPEPTATPVSEDDPGFFTEVVDAAQENVTAAYPIDSENFSWQKFVPEKENISTLDLWIEISGTPTDLTVVISDEDDVELGRATLSSDDLVEGWNSVEFSPPITLTPNQAYKISTSTLATGRSPDQFVDWGGGPANSSCPSCTSDISEVNTEFSYAFRTYSRVALSRPVFLPLVVRD